MSLAVLSACERLRLRNSLAGKRLQQSTAWFQPRCDPETGSWAPVQCLGKSAAAAAVSPTDTQIESAAGVSRAFTVHEPPASATLNAVGVCWCADKKGAPLQGSLTRGIEPTCNHRQARRRKLAVGSGADAAILNDPMIEQLIGQITLIADEDNVIETTFEDDALLYNRVQSVQSATERIMAIARAAEDADDDADGDDQTLGSTLRLHRTGTRCQALRLSAPFPVACAPDGSFEPQQCSEAGAEAAVCWCVDAAGNQLPQSSTFSRPSATVVCPPAAVDAVAVELRMPNPRRLRFRDLYDLMRGELRQLLGGVIPDNLRVHELPDGSAVHVQFELSSPSLVADDAAAGGEMAAVVDTAFALEEMVRLGTLRLANGRLQPDATQSRFQHHLAVAAVGGGVGGSGSGVAAVTGVLGPQSAALQPESTFQMVVFLLATTSAFLVSVFVVFVMLKRGRQADKANKVSVVMRAYESAGSASQVLGRGDKYLDYSSPIFVLSPSAGGGEDAPKA